MSTEYVSRDETEAHEAAMQRVVEEEKEHEAIEGKKKRAIKHADDKIKKIINDANQKMRKAIEAAQRENDKAIKAAKKVEEDEIKVAEMLAEKEQASLKRLKEEKLATMQKDFECLPLLRQVYHEAPDDVFELIVSKCSKINGWGWGGLNAFRLANKRLMRFVESCTTRLMNVQREDGPDSLPIPIIQRCRRIVEIRCSSRNLRSLEGCSNGLKNLAIGCAPHLSDLSQLASCSTMKSLEIYGSSVTDISAISSMPLLEVFILRKNEWKPSIKDISPLSSCPRLKRLDLDGNNELNDLTPLSACTDLVTLCISNCPLITSLDPLSFSLNLKTLHCYDIPLITSLAPLSSLSNLIELRCQGIHPQTSLLPLKSCAGLESLYCRNNAANLKELKRSKSQGLQLTLF